MQRVPEPELMDEEEQARAYALADFSEPHDRFVAELTRRVGPLSGSVLDLGCGPGDVTIRVARAFPECRVDGVDGAEAMLRHGRVAVERAGLGRRVTLTRAFLPDETPPGAPYDAVISNSLLHHLSDPAVLWRSIASFGRPGARVFVMDLARPPTKAAADAFVAEYAAGEPEILRRDFLLSLCAAYTPGEVCAQVRAAGLALEVEAVGDRHLIAFS